MAGGGGIITVEYTTGGTATCVQDTEYGQYYVLTATPSSGYTFSYWKVMTTDADGSIRYDNGNTSGGGYNYNDQFTYNPMWAQDGMGVDTVFKAFFEPVATTPDNLQTKTTKLITYAKSQLSSKGVASTATTLRGALDDIANISAGGDNPSVATTIEELNNLAIFSNVNKIAKYTGEETTSNGVTYPQNSLWEIVEYLLSNNADGNTMIISNTYTSAENTYGTTIII